MAWIKRNLGFLIGTVVAVVLLGVAGWYGYSKFQLNDENYQKLEEGHAKLKEASNRNPHPGDEKVNNIQTAKDQTKQVRDFMAKCRKYFQRIPPIPDMPKVSSQDFTAALSQTIAQLQHEATNSSVALPPDFGFSFQAERPLLTFASGSLEPLSVQLGEVRAICDILFKAKVNSIENIRRERVSDDDAKGPSTDYLELKSVTNELAIISPYEVTFRCFSSELASVLSGFGASPYSLIVKTINVEQAPITTPEPTAITAVQQPVYTQPQGPTPEQIRRQKMSEDQMMRDRYNLSGGSSRYGPTPAAPAPAVIVPTGPTPPAARGGLPTVLDEKQLKVSIMLSVIKLIPSKEK